ncbi:hypothetical protein [Yersinia ruckeri]|nr:hypothetical protein [Yersinia ruckeri]UIN14777.1 hypothetical protein LGL85_03910 [Yersinia ruckeri]
MHTKIKKEKKIKEIKYIPHVKYKRVINFMQQQSERPSIIPSDKLKA